MEHVLRRSLEAPLGALGVLWGAWAPLGGIPGDSWARLAALEGSLGGSDFAQHDRETKKKSTNVILFWRKRLESNSPLGLGSPWAKRDGLGTPSKDLGRSGEPPEAKKRSWTYVLKEKRELSGKTSLEQSEFCIFWRPLLARFRCSKWRP